MASAEDIGREQRDYWNGISGERWVKNQAIIDRALRPFGGAALDALAPVAGERVLDVGCGSGATLLELAERVAPGGAVVGADISQPLLAHARQRTQHVPSIRVLEADAASHDFGGGFQGLFSRFGVMFFGDPVAAFGRLRQQLVPGGRLAFVCWQAIEHNAWCRVPLEAARPLLVVPGEPPAPGAPGPFAFSDRQRVQGILTGAGFQRVNISPFLAPVLMSDEGVDAAVEYALRVGPVSRLLAEQPDAVKQSIRDCLQRTLEGVQQGSRVTLEGAAWVVSARA